ncbi:MAG: T9SS type A sorting domain-containing protein [Lentimicrobiaceae bacterium]|nr:T9SS type A sorting domain-containing protein [Lentimicrobiaceae bacterium]
MNRITLLAVFFALATQLEAQNPQFPDGGFESCWEYFNNPNHSPGKNNYWDFKSSYFLSTLNSLHELEGDMGDAPLTVFRIGENVEGDNVYKGKYSLKLVSNKMVLGGQTIFLPGVAATLRIKISPMACTFGEPFTAKPTALVGARQYIPVNGDSAAIEVFLQKDGTVLGRGKEVITKKDAVWTDFKVPIVYTSNSTTLTPDTIVVIFAASAKYNFTNDIETLMQCEGQINSTLYLDNIAFDYELGVKELFSPEIRLNVYPNPSKERVSLQLEKETEGAVIIYDYLIRKMGEYPLCGTQIDIDIQDYAAGSYLINVVEKGKVITSGRFVKE